MACGGTFVDIGANIGAFTLQAARLENVHVLAIEPNPTAMERLKVNLAVNGFGNASTVESAVGKTTEESFFTFVHDDMGKSGIGTRAGGGEREVRRLSIRTLDEILAEHGIDSIAALKVDVEGHEDDVLMPFFEAAKCEQWPRLLIIEDNRPSPLRVLSVLNDHGYIEILRTKANVTLALPKDGKELGP